MDAARPTFDVAAAPRGGRERAEARSHDPFSDRGPQDADSAATGGGRYALMIASALILPLPVLAAGLASAPVEASGGFRGTVQHFLNQFRDPWTWFGLSAQGLFF